MPAEKHALNEEHFATFRWWSMEWSRHFGVDMRWQISVTWADDLDSGKYAWVIYSGDARKARIELQREFRDIQAPSMRVLAETACHEVIHILLAPLADYAELGAPRCVDTIGIEHEIVQTLMQLSMRAHFDSMMAACPHKV